MNDPQPPTEEAELPLSSEAHSRRDGGADLGPAYALFKVAVADLIPSGTLGPDTVPASALAIPINRAIELLVRHLRQCRHPRCALIPPPLVRYRRMRPDAIRQARDSVYDVLWKYPDHSLVTQVRGQVLAKYRDLVNELSTGDLLVGGRLQSVLSELGEKGPKVLCAVIWAARFEGPSSEELFRALSALTQKSGPRQGQKAERRSVTSVRSLEADLRKATRQRKKAEESAKQAKDSLRAKERALGKAKNELADAQRALDQAATEIDTLRTQKRVVEADLAESQRNAEKLTKINTELRRDLRQLQRDQRDLELQRGDLARQLASERREIEKVKLRLACLPKGADAVRDFLRAEEERIENDRLILSGGARERANQEWTNYRKLERAFLNAFPVYRQPPPALIRPKVPLRLVTLGGSGEVGRSCYLLELGGKRILVDCGIKPNNSKDLHPAIEQIESLDALILTHAHTDHVGWVPALVRKFNNLDIYCSEGTAALLPVVLEDCHTHYMRKMATARERAKYIRNADPIAEAYDADEVQAVPKLAITCKFGEDEALPFGGVSIRFYPAGHVLGAASVLITDQSGRKIFMSGDFSSFDQLTVPAASWPEDLGEIDLLVLESTYGGHVHNPLEDSRAEMVSFIRDTVETRQGSVILASFALGRAQELLSALQQARKNGEIPLSVPIHVDGMIRRINPIYRKFANFQVSPDEFYEISGEAERAEVIFEAQRKPAIIVTTSGMMAGGPVIEYAKHLLPDPRHRILLAGYQDEGAPSRALRDIERPGRGPRSVTVTDEAGDPIEFEAALPAKEVSLSSHADQPGIIRYAEHFRPKTIALVHGEPEKQSALRSRLIETHERAEIICGPDELLVP